MSLTVQPMTSSDSKTLNLHHTENYPLTLNHILSEPSFRPPINSLFQPEHVLLTSACVHPMKSRLYWGGGTYIVEMISSLVLLISRTGPWYLEEERRRSVAMPSLSVPMFISIRCVTFSDADFMTYVRMDRVTNSLDQLLSIVEVHVPPDCVLDQRSWETSKIFSVAKTKLAAGHSQYIKELYPLQLSGMTLRARGRRSSKEASSTTDWISGYDITAQLAKKANRDIERWKRKDK